MKTGPGGPRGEATDPGLPMVHASRSARRAAAGFTLLEVVVAVALLALILATALELLAIGLRSAKAAGDHSRAALLARRILAELPQGPLTPGLANGSSGPYRWTAEISPQGEEEGTLPVRLYTLRVRVAWPGKRGEKGLELVSLQAVARSELAATTRPAPPPSASDPDSDPEPGQVP